MIRIREFIQSGNGLSQTELFAMIREHMLFVPVSGQRVWLHEVENSLDCYVGDLNLSAVRRVKDVLAMLNAEISVPRSAMVLGAARPI